jgi:fructose-1,6-bisphosphatase/inositol monophosphatase family enzyme
VDDESEGGAFDHELAFVLAFAAEAVALVHELRQGRQFALTTKPDGSFITTVDRHVNSAFIEAVSDPFPLDRVLGEEESRSAPGPRTWVIDPIDGTDQFALGIPTYMIAIALTDGAGQPVVACLANPSTRELYHAVRGRGAFRDGERLEVSKRDGVREPVIVRTSGVASAGRPTRLGSGLRGSGLARVSLAQNGDETGVVPVRYPWPSVFSGCKVAEGTWDADLYDNSAAHDVAATALLVIEAGGLATDRDGAQQRYDRPVNGCILSNGVVHDALVRHWRPDPL